MAPATPTPKDDDSSPLKDQSFVISGIFLICVFMVVLVYIGDMRSKKEPKGTADQSDGDLEAAPDPEFSKPNGKRLMLSETTPLLSPESASSTSQRSDSTSSWPSESTDSSLESSTTLQGVAVVPRDS